MVRALSGQSPLKTTPKSVLFVLFSLLIASAGAGEDRPEFRGPFQVGNLAEPANREASGLAISRRSDNLIWTHDDSGGEPVLFALGTDGTLRGKVRLEGVTNVDWEDIASAEISGQPMLVVGDTGDNAAQRPRCVIHLVSEPDPAQLTPGTELVWRPEYSIHYIYEDGARDVEGVAVDAKEGAIYLLSKRDSPARLYRLPLHAASSSQPAVARRVGTVPHLPRPTVWDKMIKDPHHAFRGQPTALDFSVDGTLALVLTYGRPLLFPRHAGETWAEALSREPVSLAPHALPQAEGACFTGDGRAIYVCSEKALRLLRYDRR